MILELIPRKYSKEASIKYVSQTGDSIDALYMPPVNTNEKNSLCDFDGKYLHT